MNTVIEEALTNIIRRMEIAESRLDKIEGKTKTENKDFNAATPGQLKFIKSLGGVTYNMTKKEAGILIDELLKAKDKKKLEKLEPEKKEYSEPETMTAEQRNKLMEELGEEAFL